MAATTRPARIARRAVIRVLAMVVAASCALVLDAGIARADTPGGTAVIGTQDVVCHVSSCPITDIGNWMVDMNGDGHADVVAWDWMRTGAIQISLLDGHGNVTGTQQVNWTCGYAGQCLNQWWIRGFADLNDDGHPDVLWWNTATGQLASWLLNGAGIVIGTQTLSWPCNVASGCAVSWHTIGLADMNGDGHADLTWWNATTGQVSSWLLNGAGTVIGNQILDRVCPWAGACAGTQPLGVGDANGDGIADLTWYNDTTGVVSAWLLTGTGHVSGVQSVNWTCARGCATPLAPVDMNGDGQPDLPWKVYVPATDTNRITTWLLNKPSAAPPPQNQPCPICH